MVKINNCIAKCSWVPAISRSFHYWQQAPRLRLTPVAGKSWQTRAMSPQAFEGRQALITLIKQWKRQGRGGEGRGGETEPSWGQKTATQMLAWPMQQECRIFCEYVEFWYMCPKRHRWPWSNTCALYGNTVELHLTTLKNENNSELKALNKLVND